MSKIGKKITIICIIVIMCTLLSFLIPIIYKINIVVKSLKAYDKYIESNNYKYVYENNSHKYGPNQCVIYKKGDKLKTITEYYPDEDGRIEKYTAYIQGNSKVYVNDEEKTFLINTSSVADYMSYTKTINRYTFSQIEYYIQSEESLFQKVKDILKELGDALPDEVTLEEYEGKDCYKCTFINKYKQSERYTSIGIEEIYLEKETFLPVYSIQNIYEKGDHVRKLMDEKREKYTYDFDIVTDNDVDLPDLSEYKQSLW